MIPLGIGGISVIQEYNLPFALSGILVRFSLAGYPQIGTKCCCICLSNAATSFPRFTPSGVFALFTKVTVGNCP